MGSPGGGRSRGVVRRHWLAISALWLAVAVVIGVAVGVREKIAGYQLTATIGPAPDPAAAALEPLLPAEFRGFTAPPDAVEIARFLTAPGTRNQVGAYPSTDLAVKVDDASQVVTLVVGDDERARAELSLDLYLRGYRDLRGSQLRAAADEVAVTLAGLAAELEEQAAQGGPPETVAELVSRAAELRVAADAVATYPERSNGGIATSVIDVGGSVWRTSPGRAVGAAAAALVVVAAVVGVVAALDRRVRTRSDLASIDPDVELIGVVGAGGRGDDIEVTGRTLAARLGPACGAVAVISVGCDGHAASQVADALPLPTQQRVVVPGPPGPDEIDALGAAERIVVAVGWGSASVDDLALTLGRVRATGRPLAGAVLVDVPDREIPWAHR